MGVEVAVHELTKKFGRQTIWGDVTLTLPPGEVTALLGPSGTGKSVFLKALIGLLKPDKGSIIIRDVDIARCSESKLYETRKLFGVLFQDGALFGSMTLYDNVAFPLREHTKKSESEIRSIVMEKMDMVGLAGAEKKLPGEISGGMRKRAGLARALVLNPEIILVDEPDSGLDPVRTTYISQLFLDINAATDATFLIVTHNINMARTVPDNLGMLFRRELVMFGPREVLLTSEEPVIKQFLNGKMNGPIGMSEEKDAAQMAAERAIVRVRPPRRRRRGRPASPCRSASPGHARAQGRRPPPPAGQGHDAHAARGGAEGHPGAHERGGRAGRAGQEEPAGTGLLRRFGRLGRLGRAAGSGAAPPGHQRVPAAARPVVGADALTVPRCRRP